MRTRTLMSTAVLGLQLLHGALAAVTGGGSNGSFVVGADDSTALRLIRPAILRLAGALWQSALAPGVTVEACTDSRPPERRSCSIMHSVMQPASGACPAQAPVLFVHRRLWQQHAPGGGRQAVQDGAGRQRDAAAGPGRGGGAAGGAERRLHRRVPRHQHVPEGAQDRDTNLMLRLNVMTAATVGV